MLDKNKSVFISTLKCQHIHNEKKYILYEIIIIKINTNLGCKRFLIGEKKIISCYECKTNVLIKFTTLDVTFEVCKI